MANATSLRIPRLICNTCRASISGSRFATLRAFGTTSWPQHEIRSEPIPQKYNRNITRGVARPSQKERISRQYSTASLAPQPTSSGFAPLPHRRLISLSGADAAKFLQGLVTNNVDASSQASFYSAFLDARGRVLWDVFVWVWPELVAEKGDWACYIEVDEGEVEALMKHLKRHKLRSKVQLSSVSEDELRVWAAWGTASELVHEGRRVIAGLKDARGPDMHRYLTSGHTHTVAEDGAEPADTQEYHLHRYRCGIAEGPQEIVREAALPMECNIDLWHGIDFKKGCYVGQELTIRTKHTGIVRKRILPVQLQSPAPPLHTLPEPHTDIKQLDEHGAIKKGRAAGKFVAGIGDVGLALCRLENMTSIKVSAEGGTWKPGLEFGCETPDGGVVKVVPVLYDWFVRRERELWDKNRLRM
ncbi:Aminomethyltransferase folate-binding domain-containing protein [Decorospora gaudefroyi]|uniref:Iron-sulfur cluster assembly factor IBA57 homolog, mitochondrial n=1 Tax=Decorospora gaudefroyi TaxID=184978 RepID=A0A6A5K5K4_9PLEO|nr:Aminomethyltransferase folate-binding domain-containing protein [Decorospora gaudefroyi]